MPHIILDEHPGWVAANTALVELAAERERALADQQVRMTAYNNGLNRAVADGSELPVAPQSAYAINSAFDARYNRLMAERDAWMVAHRDELVEAAHAREDELMAECYVELCERFQSSSIVELGIAAGGSTALISLLARPKKLVALEIDPLPLPALADFIAARGLSSEVRPYYGVDQADRQRVAEIMDHEFAGEPLHLVIDDASHLLVESRTSFESLFPRLRPGGLFILEDWNGMHLRADKFRAALSDPSMKDDGTMQRRLSDKIDTDGFPPTPLYRLVVELMLARARLRIGSVRPSSSTSSDRIVDRSAGMRRPALRRLRIGSWSGDDAQRTSGSSEGPDGLGCERQQRRGGNDPDRAQQLRHG